MQNLIGDSSITQNTGALTEGTRVTSMKASNCQTNRLLVHLHNTFAIFPLQVSLIKIILHTCNFLLQINSLGSS